MTARSQLSGRLSVVFGLPEVEAAAAVGVSVTKFRELVEGRRMPRPRKIDTRRIYDVDEIRAAFKALPHEDEVARSKWSDIEA